MTRSMRKLILNTSSMACLVLANHAQAEEAPSSGAQLETIVVTAQKSDTGLQRTPIAITAMSAERLAKSDIRSTVDLDKQVPGMTVSDGGAFPLNVTIRGVGYDGVQNLSAQPGVAFVQNGVYVASPVALSASFLDLNQLEVLRGPQGTVNGQNADGGAMNVTTAMPKFDGFHLNAEASYGSYNYNREKAIVNVPASDTLALRVAVQHEGHDGWYYAPNQPVNKHVGDQQAWMGRATLTWKATDRLTFTVWGESFANDSKGVGAKSLFDTTPGARTTSNDYPIPEYSRSRIAAGNVSYDLGFATAKSITSYQYIDYDAKTSPDMLSTAGAISVYGVKDYMVTHEWSNNSVTEEFNIASKPGGRLDWIVGLFYLHTAGREHVFEVQQNASQTGMPFAVDYAPAYNGALYAAASYLPGAYGLAFVSVSHSQRHSWATYGQTTLHLFDKLRLTGGLRYSWDKYSADTAANGTVATLTSQFNELTGKATLEYDLSRHSTWYASFSTGVKPGGANLNPSSLLVPSSFAHEFVRAYEVGTKNELFDRKLRLNLSAFYNDYRNLQADSEDPLPFQGGMTNIPKSHTYGVEAEVALILPQGWRIDANAAAMGSKVDSHFQMLDPFVAQQVNRKDGGVFVGNDIADRFASYQDVYGHQLGRVPNFSSTVGLSKASDLGAYGKLDSTIQASYRSPFWQRVYNNPVADRVGSQFTMNLNLHYAPAKGPWYAEFQVTNLTASRDVASRYAENFGVGGVFDTLVAPRQFIGRLGVNF